jgi:DNA invertase Pin-like site-specific DNA recombinase
MSSFDRSMVIVIYARSSRAEHLWALESQEAAVREHLARLGIPHDRAGVIRDATNGVMADRPGYMRVVTMCEQGTAILLAVEDLTRIGRLGDIMGLIRRIVEVGGRFVSAEESVDTSQPGWQSSLEHLLERRAHLAAHRRWREVAGD